MGTEQVTQSPILFQAGQAIQRLSPPSRFKVISHHLLSLPDLSATGAETLIATPAPYSINSRAAVC